MLLSACMLLVVLLTTTQVEAAATAAAESVMERPVESKVLEARGVEGNGEDMSVAARQGMSGVGQDVFSLTMNALNPMPYLLGGLNGMRQVMHQRLHPFNSMNGRHVPRQNKFRGGGRPPLPRIPSGGNFKIAPGGLRYGGGSGGSGVSGGGGLRNAGSEGTFIKGSGSGGGGGGGGMHAISHDSQTPEGEFLRQVRGTKNEQKLQVNPYSTFPISQRPLKPSLPPDSVNNKYKDFGTLKPHSVMNNRPGFRYFLKNITVPPTIPTTTAPQPKTIRTEAVSSSARGNKLTRVINIRVPEEMQDLAILEISMKANGDISLSGGPDKEQLYRPDVSPRHPRPRGSIKTPGASTLSSAALLSSLGDIFDEDHRLHELDSDDKFLDSLFRRDVEIVTHKDSDVQDFLIKPYSASPSQDSLRMQTAENTNPALLNAFPVDWSSVNSLQPIVISNKDMHHDNYQRNVQLPNLFTKNTPLASFSNYAQNSNLNKFYYLPLGVSPSSHGNPQAMHSRPLVPVHQQPSHIDDKNSPVYYIDITIPGNPGGIPSVNAKRLTRRRRSLDFDGWFPMDVSNPMSDDPTVAYKPPPLERVHFSNEPIMEKPLYPVRPENPTVFVVRSEMQEPEYHSVYGTENIEYYHINPQSNTVRAFRSPSFSIGEVTLVSAQTDATTTSTTQSNDEVVDESSRAPETNLEIPKKEDGFSDKSGVFYDDTEPSNTESSLKENLNCENETESDMEGAFSEIQASVIRRPDLLYLLRDRNKKFSERTISQGPEEKPSPARRRIDSTSTSGDRRALYELLGNLPRESQIEEAPYLGSATDSAGASFVRQIPPPNFRYSSQRTASSRLSPVTSRSRVTGNTARNPVSSGRPWYLIDTRSTDSSRRREPSIASYIIPETLSSDNKVHYKPQGPVSYVNKQEKTLSDLIDNPHLDDHMNSYKPTLTANSLSELLQIFRYTQVTGVPNGSATEQPVTVREFRYTRPTEETPTTDIFPSSFRYTPSPSKFSDPTTEAGITERPPAVYSDAVADTNSLDGYLFSDSEANPEYARPQVRPNAIVSENKNTSKDKGAARGTSKVKISSNLVQRTTATTETPKNFRVIYPGPAPSTKVPTASPQYVIYQGHSRVKVFGVNSAEDNDWSKFDISDIFLASTPSSTSATTTAAPPLSSTTSLPTTTTTSAPTLSSLTPLPSTNATLSSTLSSPVEESTSIPVTDPTPSDTTEATLPTTGSEEYEYYYADGDYAVTDLAFGDYQTEDLGQPLIYVSGQLPPPPNAAHLVHSPPQASTEEAQDMDILSDHSVQDSPQVEDTFPQALSPATALTRAEFPVAKLDVLADQQSNVTEDSQFSDPTWPQTQSVNNNPTVNGTAESVSGA